MLPQAIRFHDGSGVCHRLTFGDWPGCRFSVWVNADGEYVDAERIDRNGRSHAVKGIDFQRTLAQRAATWLRHADKPCIVGIPA